MRLHPHSPTPLSYFLLLLPSLATGISLTCADIRVDGKSFDLEPLGGPHSIYKIKDYPHNLNTTFTLDICNFLEKKKGVPKDEDCPNSSRVCAIQRLTNTSTFIDSIPIAGEYSHTIGGALDPKWTSLSSSPSNADQAKDGLRLEMNGGKFESQKQKAIVEFLCDAKAGNDSKVSSIMAAEEEEDNDNEEESDEGGETDDDHGGKIKFVSWETEGDTKVLRLDWTTKYGCEDAKDDSRPSSSGHWGFFAWFIIIAFMGIAAYLIFGSWLNWQRHSARGWDLVPHSETLRDIPYLFRDWARRIVNTFQGGGSRGGYSAV